ncbi:MAG: peptidylprolyl isomerase [Oryzomonas sp.]|uniref:peptidylprolyl isomerase n=1 Tax=Oryzomonas sp. TaxID=2855186 RepID=UPI00283B12A6|nr:peptidylprolyl isomerase [Oryzomonas sp.]MDR3579737.1 peptidylprolyl isomerase [Oryzomonas sp.]
MYSKNTLSKSLILIGSMLMFISACSLSSSKGTSAVPAPEFSGADANKTVARVNDKEITAVELKRAEKILIANKPGLQIPPTMHKEFEKQVLNQEITSELLFQESRKLEIKDLDKQVEAKIAQVKNGFPDSEKYVKQLGSIGLDEKTFADSVRRDISIAYVVKTEIAPGISVRDEEVKKFYDQNPDKFRQEEQVRASHILIGVDAKAGPEAQKAARDKAEKLRAELVKGAAFATLAKENSTCPSSRQGGDLGFFGKGKMVPPFEQAAFALKPGELSPVVESQFGYHIIKVVERKKAETITFSAAKNKIEEYIKAQKTNLAIDVFVGELRKNAKVEVLL